LKEIVSDHYYCWAWTPELVAAKEKSDRRADSMLILPDSPAWLDKPTEAAIAHFSILKDGEEYSWLWLFQDQNEAIALKILPDFLGEDDPDATMITSTLPPTPPGERSGVYLQPVPATWLKDWQLQELGVHEIWIGFDFRKYRSDRNLRVATTNILSTEEFLEALRHAA
jgi:hypothetical protein